MYKCSFLLFLSFLCIQSITAQSYDLRGYFGVSYYLGDLAPYSHFLSYAEGHAAVGISAGIKLDKVLTIHGRFTRAYLSGDDKNSAGSDRQNRNLNFVSPLYEYGLFADINISTLIPHFDKYGINVYLTNGIALFKFNPQAYYDGQLIALQPLGTEGQGVPEFNKAKPYGLLQIALITGLGFDFAVNETLNFGLELAPRKTFTDYLDDVSGSYINFDEQLDVQGSLTANLANRTGEKNGGVPKQFITGSQRGDSTDDDWYLLTSIYMSYRFSTKREKAEPQKKE